MQNCDLMIEMDVGKIIKHLSKHLNKQESISCPVLDPVCSKTFVTYVSFNRHKNDHKKRDELNLFNIKPNNETENEQLTSEIDSDIDNIDALDTASIPEANAGQPETREPIVVPILQAAIEDSCNIDILHDNIEHIQGVFALKMCGKYLLPRDVITDILSHSNEIHTMKMELINEKLKQNFGVDSSINIKDITENIELIDNTVGLKEQLSTPYKRNKYLGAKFKFIKPEYTPIGKIGEKESFYYTMPISKTLKRLLKDTSIKRYIIKYPVFIDQSLSEKIYRSFEDGQIIRQLNITGPYILLEIFIDGFGTNNPIGTSRDQDKIVGVYYRCLTKISKRATIATLALLNQSDITEFGLRVCLKKVISELTDIVNAGILDGKRHIQVRIIANLGDNLGQNEVISLLILWPLQLP